MSSISDLRRKFFLGHFIFRVIDHKIHSFGGESFDYIDALVLIFSFPDTPGGKITNCKSKHIAIFSNDAREKFVEIKVQTKICGHAPFHCVRIKFSDIVGYIYWVCRAFPQGWPMIPRQSFKHRFHPWLEYRKRGFIFRCSHEISCPKNWWNAHKGEMFSYHHHFCGNKEDCLLFYPPVETVYIPLLLLYTIIIYIILRFFRPCNIEGPEVRI